VIGLVHLRKERRPQQRLDFGEARAQFCRAVARLAALRLRHLWPHE
jgi:hypothetical protein